MKYIIKLGQGPHSDYFAHGGKSTEYRGCADQYEKGVWLTSHILWYRTAGWDLARAVPYEQGPAKSPEQHRIEKLEREVEKILGLIKGDADEDK